MTEIEGDWPAALAALAWQYDLGVQEVVQDTPLNRYALPEAARPLPAAAPPAAVPATPYAAVIPSASDSLADAVAEARQMAAHSGDLAALRDAIQRFDHCELKRGARNLVFADGLPTAHVLVLGEAPGAEEDREGRPFVGRAGQLLDAMFAAIGLSRTATTPHEAIYITNVLPWRPPGNRDPEPAEIDMMRPFVERHIGLIDPKVIVVMGNTPLFTLTGARGILKARGTWSQALDRPLLPMAHPAYLLRNPGAKRDAWADLLALQAKIHG